MPNTLYNRDNQSNKPKCTQYKQGTLVPLLSKCHCYACIYRPMINYAIAQKITIQPL